MSLQTDLARLSAQDVAERLQPELIPLGNRFAYLSVALSLSEDDLKEYLAEPIAALPPALCAQLPRISILLVPYLEKVNGRRKGQGTPEDLVCYERPPEDRMTFCCRASTPHGAALVLALKDQDVADCHYWLYRLLADVIGEQWNAETQDQFCGLLREELRAGAHGEVDEESWRLKQTLLRRQTKVRRRSKAFMEYGRQSFVDTLTLYLHGICCDIDVETGPRQLASRHLRRRLELLHALYPPPAGYAVFPEDVSHA